MTHYIEAVLAVELPKVSELIEKEKESGVLFFKRGNYYREDRMHKEQELSKRIGLPG